MAKVSTTTIPIKSFSATTSSDSTSGIDHRSYNGRVVRGVSGKTTCILFDIEENMDPSDVHIDHVTIKYGGIVILSMETVDLDPEPSETSVSPTIDSPYGGEEEDEHEELMVEDTIVAEHIEKEYGRVFVLKKYQSLKLTATVVLVYSEDNHITLVAMFNTYELDRVCDMCQVARQ
jgi:hypothetical protein